MTRDELPESLRVALSEYEARRQGATTMKNVPKLFDGMNDGEREAAEVLAYVAALGRKPIVFPEPAGGYLGEWCRAETETDRTAWAVIFAGSLLRALSR